jgi:hypothetical protein
VDYIVTVDTTDIRGNGMDGRALLTIHGARGSSNEVEMSDGSDTMFERGSMTQVIVTAPDLNIINAITVRLVRHDNCFNILSIFLISSCYGPSYLKIHTCLIYLVTSA